MQSEGLKTKSQYKRKQHTSSDDVLLEVMAALVMRLWQEAYMQCSRESDEKQCSESAKNALTH